MYNFLTKYGQLAAFAVGALITVIFIFSIFSGLSDFNMFGPKDPERFKTGIFDFGITVTLALIAIAFIAMIVFILINTIGALTSGDFKGLLGIIIALVVFVICYFVAEPLADGPLKPFTEKFNVTDGQGQLISGGVNASIVMIGIALAVFVLSEIRNIFK